MKLYGRVLCLGGRFHPTIESDVDVLWRGVECVDVRDARLALAEAVALAGLCFWPPSYLNDNGREVHVSPWTIETMKRACVEVGQALIDAECRPLEALLERHPEVAGNTPGAGA